MGNCCLTSDEASKISSSENHHRYSNGTHPHAATATGSASESNESPGGINLAARNKKQRRRKGRGQAPPLSHIQDRPSIEEPRAASVTSVAVRRWKVAMIGNVWVSVLEHSNLFLTNVFLFLSKLLWILVLFLLLFAHKNNFKNKIK
jgi:hypothetical protein